MSATPHRTLATTTTVHTDPDSVRQGAVHEFIAPGFDDPYVERFIGACASPCPPLTGPGLTFDRASGRLMAWRTITTWRDLITERIGGAALDAVLDADGWQR